MWIDVHRCIYAGTYQGTAKHGATGLNAKAAQPLSESELGLVHSNPPVRLPMQATSAQHSAAAPPVRREDGGKWTLTQTELNSLFRSAEP